MRRKERKGDEGKEATGHEEIRNTGQGRKGQDKRRGEERRVQDRKRGSHEGEWRKIKKRG